MKFVASLTNSSHMSCKLYNSLNLSLHLSSLSIASYSYNVTARNPKYSLFGTPFFAYAKFNYTTQSFNLYERPKIIDHNSQLKFYNKVYSDYQSLSERIIGSKNDTSKAIIINGVSCVGKTSLVNNLLKLGAHQISQDDIHKKHLFNYLLSSNASRAFLDAQKCLITQDDILKIFNGYKITKNKYNNLQLQVINDLKDAFLFVKQTSPYSFKEDVIEVIYNKAKHLMVKGQTVAIDAVFDINNVEILYRYFGVVPNVFVLLYSSLDENLKKCFQRNQISIDNDSFNYRFPEMVIHQYCNLYKFILKEEINKTDMVLEKLQKEKIIKSFEEAKRHTKFMVQYFYEDLTPEVYSEELQKISNAIDKATNNMRLSDNNEIFVVPLSTCNDFVIHASLVGEISTCSYNENLES